MSIADKLTYLNGTKSLLREAINAAGGNLTQEIPFREYAGGWLRDQSASLILDFSKQRYAVKDKVSMFPDRVGFEDIVTFTRSTGGGRFNAQGEYEWVGPDEPRIDYDPVTGKCRGLLMEEQRTNLALHSSAFDELSWTKYKSSVAPSSIAAPDLSYSFKFIENSELSDHTIFRDFPVSAGKYCVSVFAKSVERDWLLIRVDDKNAWFNISLGSIGTVDPAFGASILDWGGGWYRVTIVVNFSTSGTQRVHYRLSVGNGNMNYQGDGTSGIYIWGAQLEAGAFPTSYIPTEGAQVTRSADIATVNELSPWYNSEQGTLVVEATPMQRVTANLAATLSNSSTSLNDLIELGWRDGSIGARGRVIYNGGTQAEHVIGPGVSVGDPIKIAIAYAANSVQTAARGVVSIEDTTAVIPVVDRLQIGRVGTYGYSPGHIRSVRYYPRKLSDSELQEVTA